MSLSIVSITLNIRNNRTYPQRISVLGSPVNPLDTANAATEYRWDVTSLSLTASESLILEYKPVGAAAFSTYTAELVNPNIDTVLNALNSLGIGFFNYYTELGQNYFSTNNDNYVFGNLTINSNIPTTSTTTTTTTTAAPTTSTTTTTTTAAPITTSTTTTTTTDVPTTSTTTTTTTDVPTTSTTTTTTTDVPTTSTTTTTTTAAPTTFMLGFSTLNANAACANPQVNYYAAAGSILQNGTILYDDFNLTILAQDGYYSDATNSWLTSGGTGVLSSETPCSLTTTTTSTTTTAAPTTTTSTTTTTAAPTTTSTTTTTTTLLLVCLGYDSSDGLLACQDYTLCLV